MKAFVRSRSARLHQTRFHSTRLLNNNSLITLLLMPYVFMLLCPENFTSVRSCEFHPMAFGTSNAHFRLDRWDTRTPQNELGKPQDPDSLGRVPLQELTHDSTEYTTYSKLRI